MVSDRSLCAEVTKGFRKLQEAIDGGDDKEIIEALQHSFSFHTDVLRETLTAADLEDISERLQAAGYKGLDNPDYDGYKPKYNDMDYIKEDIAEKGIDREGYGKFICGLAVTGLNVAVARHKEQGANPEDPITPSAADAIIYTSVRIEFLGEYYKDIPENETERETGEKDTEVEVPPQPKEYYPGS